MHLRLIKNPDPQAAVDQETLFRKVRWSAMDLLARREHSRRELSSKLSQRYPECTELISRVIDDLAAGNLQSEERFTEAYVAMRKRKGYGPLRILAELSERGVERDMIHLELNSCEHNWFDEASTVLKRKAFLISGDVLADLKVRAKVIKFMHYRGFTQEHIEEALGSYCEGDLSS